jgi:hypothetical protein
MLAVTNSTFDLLVLELVFHASGLRLLLLRILTPVRARSEDDILTYARGI